ncbi:PREDICTED: lysosome membrane protein 2 [Nanorana parkeri]|uniref:lysosome membrane protein 2 n=1 Tax=Nanorana parkeri TaxID=125878 RepID=UPI0008545828|nr:PREDICTED: lysosome membrane protein 2 [Nanorana parkeri]
MARWMMNICGILSLSLLITSIVLLVVHTFMEMVETEVKKVTVLKNGTEAYNAWVDPPPPIYMKFYFFNVTNPLEVLDGEKPVVDEIGPYVYREYRPKENIEFLENGTEVSAVTPKTYVFEADLSKGNPMTDFVRTVNIPVVTLLEKVLKSKIAGILRPIIEAALKTYNEGMFTTRTVHEMLWGYKDPLLTLVHKVDSSVDEMFGLFYNMNTTNDGTYVFLSGSKEYKDFTQIVEWNGKRNLSWWTSDRCNMINGTDGTSFHPLINKDDIIYMFSSDLCRSLYAVYNSTKTVKEIAAFRFIPPAKVFANVTINPDNAGFCVPAGNCLPSGLLNVSECKQGAPIILSSPHFYQADESIVKSIEGISPNQDDHETFMDINPLTGILLRAAKRMQVNVHVRQIPTFSTTKNIQTLYFPVMHLSETALIDDESSEKLRTVLLKARLVANIPFIIMGLGILLGIIYIIMICRPHRTMEEGTEDESGPLLRTS